MLSTIEIEAKRCALELIERDLVGKMTKRLAQVGPHRDFFDMGTVDRPDPSAKPKIQEKVRLAQERFRSCLMEDIRIGKPFSLVRLGDGEGSFMFWGMHRADCPALAADCVETLWRVMFGDAPTDEALLSELQVGIAEAASNAKYLGITTPRQVTNKLPWLAYPETNAKFDIRASMSVVILWDWLLRHGTGWMRRNQHYSSAYIHKFLGLLVDDMVRLAGNVSVVSCYGELLPRLHRRCGVAAGQAFLIPPQRGNANANLGPELFPAHSAIHFPDVYREIDAKLGGMDLRGQLFFVGAGLVGKLYCEKIRRAGGMALDMGSLMDTWMGFGTRSYHNKDFRARHRLADPCP